MQTTVIHYFTIHPTGLQCVLDSANKTKKNHLHNTVPAVQHPRDANIQTSWIHRATLCSHFLRGRLRRGAGLYFALRLSRLIFGKLIMYVSNKHTAKYFQCLKRIQNDSECLQKQQKKKFPKCHLHVVANKDCKTQTRITKLYTTVSYRCTYQSLAEGGQAGLNTKPPKWREHDESTEGLSQQQCWTGVSNSFTSVTEKSGIFVIPLMWQVSGWFCPKTTHTVVQVHKDNNVPKDKARLSCRKKRSRHCHSFKNFYLKPTLRGKGTISNAVMVHFKSRLWLLENINQSACVFCCASKDNNQIQMQDKHVLVFTLILSFWREGSHFQLVPKPVPVCC